MGKSMKIVCLVNKIVDSMLRNQTLNGPAGHDNRQQMWLLSQ